MADTKITDLTAITSGVASTDVTVLVDVSDTSMAASGTDKKITVGDLATAIISAGSIATDTEVATAVSDHNSDTTSVHGIADTTALETTTGSASKVSTHAALTSSVHGISAFGATLVDDANAAAARTTLGLGTLATASTITSSDITDGTIVNADINASAAIALSKLATDPLARANHTGTQTASTISDFSEAVDDRVGSLLVAGSNVTLTYNDAGNSLTIAASGGGGGAGSGVRLATGLTAWHTSPWVQSVVGMAWPLLSRCYFTPFFAHDTVTITAIAANVTTAASSGGVIRLGVYNASQSTLLPTTVAAQGTAASDSTGIKTITLGSSITVSGWFWVATAIQVQTATIWGGNVLNRLPTFGGDTGASWAGTFATGGPTPYVDSVTGAMADNPTVLQDVTNNRTPYVAVRIS